MKRCLGCIISILIIIAVALASGFVNDAFLKSPGENAETVEFMIEPGTSVSDIADQLAESKIVKSSRSFKAFLKLFATDKVLQAGSFEITQGINYADLAELLGDAKNQEIKITIPEGYTAGQIGDTVIAALPHITEDNWKMITSHESTLKSEEIGAIIPEGHGLEGYLFPDTYLFHVDESAEGVARRMLENFHTRTTDKEITNETIILASIVEREVRGAEDMKLVADLFLRRLDIGMPLQADSTVNFVTGKKTPAVSAEDLEVDSLYNTYKYPGLPPGPISNPGLNAITAVVDPEPNEWLYFLTTDEGEVKYAKTFNEHIDNKNRFLR